MRLPFLDFNLLKKNSKPEISSKVHKLCWKDYPLPMRIFQNKFASKLSR